MRQRGWTSPPQSSAFDGLPESIACQPDALCSKQRSCCSSVNRRLPGPSTTCIPLREPRTATSSVTPSPELKHMIWSLTIVAAKTSPSSGSPTRSAGGGRWRGLETAGGGDRHDCRCRPLTRNTRLLPVRRANRAYFQTSSEVGKAIIRHQDLSEQGVLVQFQTLSATRAWSV